MTNETSFDFDHWSKIAREDPEAFENMRKQMIEEVIESASPEVKRRMMGLQWQIDQVRSTSANPMSSCIKISKMMWDNVLGDDGLVENMQQLSNPDTLGMKKPKESAQVIEIDRSGQDD